MTTTLIQQVARAVANPVDEEFVAYFRSIGYDMGLEGTQMPFELWHEIYDADGLVCQVKTRTPLAEFLSDLPHLLAGRHGIGPTNYWCACDDDAKLRALCSRVEARAKDVS